MAFIDCNERHKAGKTKWPERPHCDHGKWLDGGGTWKSPTYQTWQNVNQRVLGKATRSPEIYGNLDIEEAWVDSFSAFVEDLGPRPSREHTIDRIDPDKGYTKENTQWLLAHLNYSKGARTRARQMADGMVERMEDELKELENELLEEGIKVE